MRFSAAFRVALAPDSLTIIPPEMPFVNTFFIFFDIFFNVSNRMRCIVVFCDGRRIIPHPFLIVNTEVALLVGSTIYIKKSVHFDE